MRIHRVELHGFGPFRDAESVDFDAFEDDGLFLISGRTGAGKTSILDAVTFALFGRIPRYEAAPGEKVRSDFIEVTDRCEVAVEFSTAEGRYRVTRSPEFLRPKRRGDGMATERPTFLLEQRAGEGWEALEARVGNAERSVGEIIHLSAKQFQQVILLAQGEFQEFLVADSDKRRELLRQLFGTQRFADYSRILEDRARELREALKSSSAAIATSVDTLAAQTSAAVPEDVDAATGSGVRAWIAEVATEQAAARDGALAAAAAVEQRLAAARRAVETARSIAGRQARRVEALLRRAALAEEESSIAVDRDRLTAARRADLAGYAVDAASAAATKRERAELDLTEALRAFTERFPDVDPAPGPALEGLIQDRAELIGTLRAAAQRESTLEESRRTATRADEAVRAFEEQVAADLAKREEAQRELAAVRERLTVLEPVLAGAVAAQSALVAAQERHRFGSLAEQTAGLLTEALEDRRRAEQAQGASLAARAALHDRQLAEYAGVLAGSLEPGRACQVCGSTEHPAKATLAPDHVDEEALQEAEDRVEADRDRYERRSAEVARLQALHQTQLEQSGGADLEELAAALGTASAEVDRVRIAHEEHEQLGRRRVELEAGVADLTTALESAQERRAELTAAAGQARTVLEEGAALVAAAAGEFADVATHLAAVQAQQQVAARLREADRSAAEAVRAASEAERSATAALEEQGFTDAAAALSARVSAEDQGVLADRIEAHDRAVAGITAVLAEAELQDLPEEPVDAAPAETEFASAEAEHAAALRDKGAAERSFATVQALVARIGSALDEADQVRERYEVVDRLATTMRGQGPNTMKMMLETFVLAAELEEIVVAANARLRVMTGGRYEFRHSDALAGRGAQSGLSLDVLDAHTGEARAPQSLSGGEKFQASLALALGLAEVVTGRAGGLRLDTLFIDEGFGSLDPETLETTMATLDGLRAGGRTVGLISHVEAMKETIPAQLHVDVTPGGWSTIRQA